MAFKLAQQRTSKRRSAASGGSFHFGGAPYESPPESRTPLRVGIGVAIGVHVLLLLVSFPSLRERPLVPAQSPKTFLVATVRFKPPPPRRAEAVPQRKVKKIPIPDPTPNDPEPIVQEEAPDVPEIEIDGLSDVVFEIPEAPAPAAPPGTMWVEGDVLPPKKTHAPRPNYTEEARRARVQGVVILQAVVDALGNVDSVKVLKGLPEGLTESALQVVQQWRYEPATLHGEPVPVYINVTVNFSLQ